MVAQVSGAVQNKDDKRKQILIAAREIAGIAKDVFGFISSKYKAFLYLKFGRQDDAGLLLLAENIADQAGIYFSELTAHGLSAAMITNLQTLVTEFKPLLKLVITAEVNRDMNTQNHRSAANLLYAEISALCSTAAKYYKDRDESKYNDYIIYNLPNKQVRNGIIQAGDSIYRVLTGIKKSSVFNLQLQAGSNLEFYFSQTKNQVPGTTKVTISSPGIFTAHTAKALGWNPGKRFVHFNIHNPSEENLGKYRVMVEG
jgi:hypothetical protein